MSSPSTREREFTEFAQARAQALHRSAWFLCHDEHEAQDLVQEALTKVYVAWMRPFSRIDNPVAYAHTTLTRTFLSSRRRKASGERPTETVPDHVVDDANERTATRIVAVEALSRLSELDRAIVVARHVDDLSVAQTAELVGLSPGAVRVRSLRALQKLRGWLDVPGDGLDLPPLVTTSAHSTTEEAHA